MKGQKGVGIADSDEANSGTVMKTARLIRRALQDQGGPETGTCIQSCPPFPGGFQAAGDHRGTGRNTLGVTWG